MDMDLDDVTDVGERARDRYDGGYLASTLAEIASTNLMVSSGEIKDETDSQIKIRLRKTESAPFRMMRKKLSRIVEEEPPVTGFTIKRADSTIEIDDDIKSVLVIDVVFKL